MADPDTFDETTLHKVQIKQLEDRYVIIIDDQMIFVAEEF